VGPRAESFAAKAEGRRLSGGSVFAVAPGDPSPNGAALLAQGQSSSASNALGAAVHRRHGTPVPQDASGGGRADRIRQCSAADSLEGPVPVHTMGMAPAGILIRL